MTSTVAVSVDADDVDRSGLRLNGLLNISLVRFDVKALASNELEALFNKPVSQQ